ncbi:hypothetical protein Tco_0959640, partial [Tanacetum coccineum]
ASNSWRDLRDGEGLRGDWGIRGEGGLQGEGGLCREGGLRGEGGLREEGGLRKKGGSPWRSLKALDEGYSRKNYVRKFLRALHPKRRAKVTAIEESKDLTSLSLDELIGNLKVYEMIIKKDFEIVKEKGERKYLALKDKKCGDPNHLIGECPKPPRDKNQRAFIGGSWSDSGEEDDEKVKDETCLIAQA